MTKGKIPKKMQSVLWSVDINKLDLKKDRHYIVHQILMRGSFNDLKWLLKIYPKKEIRNLFYHQPVKIYPEKVYFFIKNFVLNLANKNIDDQDYITSISGKIRPRATKNILST